MTKYYFWSIDFFIKKNSANDQVCSKYNAVQWYDFPVVLKYTDAVSWDKSKQ